MDDDSSSQSQQHSDSGSGSAPVSGADSRTGSDSNGSTVISSSQGGDTSSGMMMTNGTSNEESDPSQEEEQEDDHMDVDMSNNSNPPKPESDSITTREGKEKVDDMETSRSAKREGKADEIGLLMDLYDLQNKTGRYKSFPGSDDDKKQLFYKYWIEEEGGYGNKEELDEKVDELHARFLKNMDKNVDGPTDSIDVEILRMSHWIWGAEIESDQDQDSKGFSHEDDGDHNSGVNSNDQKDSSKQKIWNDHLGVVPMDTKNSLKKYPSSKGNEDGSSGS